MTRVALAAALVATLGGCAHRSHISQPKATPDAGKIAVYVFTAPPASRAVTFDERARAEATSELTRRLEGKKGLTIVDTPEQADVNVQLLSAAQLFSPHGDRKFDDRELTAEVTAAGKSARLAEARGDVGRTVYSLANRVDQWIAANRAQIIAARRK
jgi:hypothetical protein